MADTPPDQDPTRRLDRRYRLIVGIMVGLSAVVMLSLIGALLEEIWLATSAGAGGFIGGYLLAGGFGRRGGKGWALACLAYIGCTIAGGAFAGLFAALVAGIAGSPLGGMILGALFAPMFVLMGGFLSFVPWLVGFSVIQLIATRIRRDEAAIEPDIAKRFE